MVLDGKIGAVWCWMVRQVQCGAGWKEGAVWCWMERQVQCGAGR